MNKYERQKEIVIFLLLALQCGWLAYAVCDPELLAAKLIMASSRRLNGWRIESWGWMTPSGVVEL